MSSSLHLSKRLRLLSDAELAQLATRLETVSSIQDFFDFADALLSRPTIMNALALLSRDDIEALRTGDLSAPQTSELCEKYYLGEKTSGLYHEVVQVLDSVTIPEPSNIQDSDSLPNSVALAAIETALANLSAVDELARKVATHPIKELARGGLSAQGQQQLEYLLPHDNITVIQLLRLAELGSVVALRGGLWLAGTELDSWLASDFTQRWHTLAHGWFTSLSEDDLRVLQKWRNWGAHDAFLEHEFPLDSRWISDHLKPILSQGELLGLSFQGARTPLAEAVLQQDWQLARAMVSEVVPPYAEHVYIQHDFTIIAPGPLVPEHDSFLRRLCQVESRGFASTWRITLAGVNSLLGEGVSAENILDHLNMLAAAPLPQAITYFIEEQAQRFGLVRVRASENGCRVSSTDQMLLNTIAADRSLNALGLRKDASGELISSVASGHVLTALQEAKYPAQLENSSGEIIQPRPMLAPTEIRTDIPNPVEALISRLRGSRDEGATDDATWIARQLDLAVREKTPLVVTVRMPDGLEKEFFIDPKGLSNGRLRARDRKTDVERTLPASHITAVRQGE